MYDLWAIYHFPLGLHYSAAWVNLIFTFAIVVEGCQRYRLQPKASIQAVTVAEKWFHYNL